MSDAEERKFDIVITKDLSRLGRNYIETGTYIEDFFPRLGIRYIALNDGVDTLHDNNEIVPFKNVLNEFYSRDVSKKVKSGYLTRAKQGKFTGCLAPFGYMKDEDDPHVLVPDPDTAWIIEKIFELAAQGYGVQAIRTKFIKERIETPTWWNRQKGLRNCVTKWEKKRPEDGRFIWDESTIKEIIESPVYIGHMASHKVKYKFKIGLIGDRPRDEWIVVKDTQSRLYQMNCMREPT